MTYLVYDSRNKCSIFYDDIKNAKKTAEDVCERYGYDVVVYELHNVGTMIAHHHKVSIEWIPAE